MVSLSLFYIHGLEKYVGSMLTFDAAGGQALDSKMRRLMDLVPEHIHDRSGIFMGSYDEMEKVKKFHKVS